MPDVGFDLEVLNVNGNNPPPNLHDIGRNLNHTCLIAALTKLRNSRSVADEEMDSMIRERTSATSSVMVSNYYVLGWAGMWHPVNTPVAAVSLAICDDVM